MSTWLRLLVAIAVMHSAGAYANTSDSVLTQYIAMATVALAVGWLIFGGDRAPRRERAS